MKPRHQERKRHESRGQPVEHRRSECEACLTIQPFVDLSTFPGPIVPSLNQSVAYAGGRLFVSHRFVNPQIAVYDTAGRFLQLYDREGSGPGEFRTFPLLHAGPGSTVWAFDQDRLVRLDGRLRHIETHNLGRQVYVSGMAVLEEGQVVLASRGSSREGTVLSLIDSAGAVTRVLERAQDIRANIVVAAAMDGGYWTLRSNQLLLRRYTGAGELLRSVEIVTGFQPWEGSSTRDGVEGFDSPRGRFTPESWMSVTIRSFC